MSTRQPPDDEDFDMTAPPAPAPTRRGPTTTLHVRIREDYDAAIRAYSEQHESNLTNVIDQALGEYLHRRGIHPDQQQ